MADPRIQTWAEVLVGYSIEIRAGDVVVVRGGVAAEPLLRAVAREVLRRGGHPVLLPTFPDYQGDLLALGSDEQLAYVSPVERFVGEQANAVVTVQAATNTKATATVDPARQAFFAKAREGVFATWLRRAADGDLRWASTLYPTAAHAQDADLPTDEFAEFIYAACKLNEPDPAAAWRRLSADQQRLIDWLAGKRQVRIVGPDTDLSLTIAGRTWINSDGHRNFPSGEIFTGPVEDSVEGHVRFSYPVVTQGREVGDVRLRFERGVVVEASAAHGEDFLLQTLDTDPGARRLGEFAFGTNFDITRFSKNILLDEKIGGTVHMALGAGYPDTGSANRSAVHWDLICDLRAGGGVEVDGQPFLRDGRFVV